MTKPLTTEIAPLQSVALSYNPGIAVYTVKLVNLNGKAQNVSISFDRNSGTLEILTVEK